MDEEKIRIRVREIVGRICPGEGIREVSSDDRLAADLKLDSLAMVELLTSIEDAFPLQALGHIEMIDIVTVGDLEKAVTGMAAA